MTRRRGLPAALALALVACGCDRDRRAPPPSPPLPRPGQAWRDQLFFLPDGDADPVLIFCVQREGAGGIELKGWLGVEGRWRLPLYERAPLDRGRAPSLEGSLDDFADRPHAGPLRLRMVRRGALITAELRTGTHRISLSSEALRQAGETRDPEGRTRWSAGPATLGLDERTAPGVLVVEETPAEQPLRAEIDYGDFTHAVARLRDGRLHIARSSLRGFDESLRATIDPVGGAPAGPARPGAALISVEPDALVFDGARLPVLDRALSRGENPDGSPRRYELLLLGGEAGRGVAFRITPAPSPDGAAAGSPQNSPSTAAFPRTAITRP